MLVERLNEARNVSFEELQQFALSNSENSYRIVYRTPRDYRRLAKAVGLMLDIRVYIIKFRHKFE